MTPRRNKPKQAPTHPWVVAGVVAKRNRVRKIAAAIAAMRAKRS